MLYRHHRYGCVYVLCYLGRRLATETVAASAARVEEGWKLLLPLLPPDAFKAGLGVRVHSRFWVYLCLGSKNNAR
jgi:hypothetical protein